MITAYHRPASLEEALTLLARTTPRTHPLGGGTLLSHGQTDSIEVVDLQALGLNHIQARGKNLEIGATATLQQLLDMKDCPEALRIGLKLEAPLNIRNAATVAGTVVTCDGRSSFITALLACDAKLTILNPKPQTVILGDYLPLRPHGLITVITMPLQIMLALEYVARTPADKPIVCVALAKWPSGRTRLAVGGFGEAPRLAMDGAETEGLETAARNAFHEATDSWGSAEYRMDVAATLSKRCFAAISAY
jgi:CO/xanthine dehydrogenase FAD-binding subunit